MSDIIIFVSCGQITPEEICLGKKVKDLIDGEPGFAAYFAETVHDLASLNSAIHEALAQCSGAVVFLHDRGTLTDKNGIRTQRSSIWINQEIAILSYRQAYEARRIPILAFKETDVLLEGAMTSMILNPLPMTSEAEMTEAVRDWLKKEAFDAGTIGVFNEKWCSITDEHRKFLACLIAEGGKSVKEGEIRKRLITDFSLTNNKASDVIRGATLRLAQEIGFVQFTPNICTGNEFSLHSTWEFPLRRKSLNGNQAQN